MHHRHQDRNNLRAKTYKGKFMLLILHLVYLPHGAHILKINVPPYFWFYSITLERYCFPVKYYIYSKIYILCKT